MQMKTTGADRPPRRVVTTVYPKRRAGVRARRVDGQMVLLNRQRELVHQLNETAAHVWDRCDGEHTVTAIASELVDEFDVDVETAEKDVATVVGQLEDAGLVDT